MFVSITSGSSCGIRSYLSQVEVDTSQALPGFDMVGYLGSEVKEARERVRVALKNAGIRIPAVRVTVNISPADIRKDGTAYDLPIAVGVLVSIGMVPEEETKDILFLGELGLGGEIKAVRGVLPVVLKAAESGIRTCIVPKENEKEAAIVKGMTVLGIADIRELLGYLTAASSRKAEWVKPCRIELSEILQEQQEEESKMPDFKDLIGQESVRRAAEIAAAGFHHLLIIGPPGSGKTMAAMRLPSILPPMSQEESIEVSKIYSVSGLLGQSKALITKRPFMSPHHTISEHALVGGGRIPRPGTISLAHRGVLFLDELPEFKREAIEALRQPLEEKQVHIARSYGTYTYPADVMLVAAMNPCPCGFYPDRSKCRCTPYEVRRYRSKISGPIMDRMDLIVEAPKLKVSELTKAQKGECSRDIRARVLRARELQSRRYRKTGFRFNAELDVGGVRRYCPLGTREQQFMEQMFESLDLSARAYHRLLKLARTIADLEGSDAITVEHLSEAVCYRMSDIEKI